MEWGNASKDERILSRNGKGETLGDIMRMRLSRRDVLKGLAATGAVAAITGSPLAKMVLTLDAAEEATKLARFDFPLGFQPISAVPNTVEVPSVAPGHDIQTVIRWGDPLFSDAPAFDPENLTAEGQEQQFGYNCDFVGFFPLEFGSDDNTKGILVVNHEYTNQNVMFREYDIDNVTQSQVDVEMRAHGVTVVEVEQTAEGWKYVIDSPLNRRYTLVTPKTVTGPAAGDALLQTSADPTGTAVFGTINNCAGGKTPWGTVLTAEENFQNYFGNVDDLPDGEVKSIHNRYGVSGGDPRFYRWLNYYDRFDTTVEANEPFRFGWIVEVDPYDPEWTPRKRTALGRFRHEAATVHIADNGKVVAYTGDDARFEYLYKFVSTATYDPADRLANRDGDLLDDGILYAAKFNADGTGEWLPLVHGEGGLEGAITIGEGDEAETFNFASQADVLIKTRLAADFLGATKMDRPEDVETNPVTGKVYMALTNNSNRDEPADTIGEAAANPRTPNTNGHIIEITEDNNDHSGTTFTWEIFMLCGQVDPSAPLNERFEGIIPTELMNAAFSGIAAPDNLAFDNQGNLWISTDGMPSGSRLSSNDGLFAVPTEGEQRGHIGQFFSSVRDSEVCGPEFTPDNKTLFLAIQHPGDDGDFDNPSSRWPDFDPNTPPRPSVLAIQAVNKDGTMGDIAVGQLEDPNRTFLPFMVNGSASEETSEE